MDTAPLAALNVATLVVAYTWPLTALKYVNQRFYTLSAAKYRTIAPHKITRVVSTINAVTNHAMCNIRHDYEPCCKYTADLAWCQHLSQKDLMTLMSATHHNCSRLYSLFSLLDRPSDIMTSLKLDFTSFSLEYQLAFRRIVHKFTRTDLVWFRGHFLGKMNKGFVQRFVHRPNAFDVLVNIIDLRRDVADLFTTDEIRTIVYELFYGARKVTAEYGRPERQKYEKMLHERLRTLDVGNELTINGQLVRASTEQISDCMRVFATLAPHCGYGATYTIVFYNVVITLSKLPLDSLGNILDDVTNFLLDAGENTKGVLARNSIFCQAQKMNLVSCKTTSMNPLAALNIITLVVEHSWPLTKLKYVNKQFCATVYAKYAVIARSGVTEDSKYMTSIEWCRWLADDELVELIENLYRDHEKLYSALVLLDKPYMLIYDIVDQLTIFSRAFQLAFRKIVHKFTPKELIEMKYSLMNDIPSQNAHRWLNINFPNDLDMLVSLVDLTRDDPSIFTEKERRRAVCLFYTVRASRHRTGTNLDHYKYEKMMYNRVRTINIGTRLTINGRSVDIPPEHVSDCVAVLSMFKQEGDIEIGFYKMKLTVPTLCTDGLLKKIQYSNSFMTDTIMTVNDILAPYASFCQATRPKNETKWA